jgi:hypothetical protein
MYTYTHYPIYYFAPTVDTTPRLTYYTKVAEYYTEASKYLTTTHAAPSYYTEEPNNYFPRAKQPQLWRRSIP